MSDLSLNKAADQLLEAERTGEPCAPVRELVPGMTAEQAVMVGDSPFDLRMAHRAGMDCVAVGYGAQPLAELLKESPKLAIERFEELRHWLGGNLSRQSREVEIYV